MAELQEDRALMALKAPTDGQLYYGVFEQGEWITGDLIKELVASGRPPQHRPFATIIPTQTEHMLVAFAKESIARPLNKGLTGIATLKGQNDGGVAVTITEVSTTPDPQGRYRIALSAVWPKGLLPAFGSQANIRLISYQNDEAILIPDKALAFGPKGWTVNLKLADGKTAARTVTVGRKSKGKTEILAGLESGQVLIVEGP